jgi:hypothetical protein
MAGRGAKDLIETALEVALLAAFRKQRIKDLMDSTKIESAFEVLPLFIYDY